MFVKLGQVVTKVKAGETIVGACVRAMDTLFEDPNVDGAQFSPFEDGPWGNLMTGQECQYVFLGAMRCEECESGAPCGTHEELLRAIAVGWLLDGRFRYEDRDPEDEGFDLTALAEALTERGSRYGLDADLGPGEGGWATEIAENASDEALERSSEF